MAKKELTAREMVEKRNEKYGKEWLIKNAKKANKASQIAKKARKNSLSSVDKRD